MRAAAGWISIFLGLGFGIPCLFAIRHLSETGQVWTFMGFPTYGGGPFEDAGIRSSAGLLAAFVVVCALEVLAGRWLWKRQRRGVTLAFGLLPFELVFWIGFALPVGLLLGAARTAALLHDRPRAR